MIWVFEGGRGRDGAVGGVGEAGDAQRDGAVVAGGDLDHLGELGAGAGEADLEALGRAEPAAGFGFGDSGEGAVADLLEAAGPRVPGAGADSAGSCVREFPRKFAVAGDGVAPLCRSWRHRMRGVAGYWPLIGRALLAGVDGYDVRRPVCRRRLSFSIVRACSARPAAPARHERPSTTTTPHQSDQRHAIPCGASQHIIVQHGWTFHGSVAMGCVEGSVNKPIRISL